METNLLTWFEIPVSDMKRAVKFYEMVFKIHLNVQDLGNFKMALFPSSGNSIGSAGSLVYNEKFYIPSKEGTLVYLNSSTGNLDEDLKNAEAAGGSILIPRRQVSEDFGFMAVILDTEGNRIALHSKS